MGRFARQGLTVSLRDALRCKAHRYCGSGCTVFVMHPSNPSKTSADYLSAARLDTFDGGIDPVGLKPLHVPYAKEIDLIHQLEGYSISQAGFEFVNYPFLERACAIATHAAVRED